MKSIKVLVVTVLLVSAASASTLYVNAISGSDTNACTSATAACKTIGHAISLAASGDIITIAAGTYKENLIIRRSLNLVGFSASTTVIDGGALNTVITIPNSAHVILSKLTIADGLARCGGGIYNAGTVTIRRSIITQNLAATRLPIGGGGICNDGAMSLNDSTVSGNRADGQVELLGRGGGGILNQGTLTINRSTIGGNTVRNGVGGGGVANWATATINDSAISANNGFLRGGGVFSTTVTSINNSTIANNTIDFTTTSSGGIDQNAGTVTIQNSIVANNAGGNCFGTLLSKGHNLSSDGSCTFNGPGDINNTNPRLGPLQNNGGPTQTMALPSGSPAIDAGNPTGCTDGLGHLLQTDQRGKPRHDTEDSGGCDMGAYEHQGD